ncbi:MAG TPA: response regulator [Spirochaetia bacterium]|nr:response regulator [Spirochaetia bacterium]
MYTFLIIDDEPIVREGISENIDWLAHGFRLVGACRDGREGIRAIEDLRPDVVLTDICMPFVDGLELAGFIADRYPETKTILLTGFDEFEYAQEAVRLKVNDLLLKPITADELRTKLDRLRAELDEERRRQRDLARLREQNQESLPLLRERFLKRLVLGELDEAEAARRCATLEIDLPGPFFNLLIIDPDRVDPDDDMRSLAIQNVVDGVMRNRAGAMSFSTEREHVVVLLSAADGRCAVDLALETAEELSERVRRTLGTTVSIGVGSPVTLIAHIDESYRGARAALGQRLVLGPHQIVIAEQIPDDVGEQVPHAEQQARGRVIREFRAGTAVQTESAVRDFVALYRSTGRSVEACYVGMLRLLADLLSAFESLGVQYSQIPETADDPFGELAGLKTLEAIEQWFRDLQRKARAVIAERQNRQSVAKALEAEDYIAAHFAEPGLSLTRLCRAISISKSYLSTVFKGHTGMTFVEYLTNIRMERARELLGSSNLKSYEVAEQVGFTDAHYFSLTFRKQTGISPTEYRDSVRGVAQ